MPKFRKKPVVIEAFQMTPERRWDNSEWPTWLHMAWNTEWNKPGAVTTEANQTGNRDVPKDDASQKLQIWTLEGVHTVDWNDWIIQGIKGELYPCKPDIFAATYEPTETEEIQ